MQHYLTDRLHGLLLEILGAVVEAGSPGDNTHDRLTERTGISPDIVAKCLDILHNDGHGWLNYEDHPRLPVRAYFTNEHFENGVGTLEQLYVGWKTRREKEERLTFDQDDEDPDDEWVEGVYKE
jgi:hypothetical protein